MLIPHYGVSEIMTPEGDSGSQNIKSLRKPLLIALFIELNKYMRPAQHTILINSVTPAWHCQINAGFETALSLKVIVYFNLFICLSRSINDSLSFFTGTAMLIVVKIIILLNAAVQPHN